MGGKLWAQAPQARKGTVGCAWQHVGLGQKHTCRQQQPSPGGSYSNYQQVAAHNSHCKGHPPTTLTFQKHTKPCSLAHPIAYAKGSKHYLRLAAHKANPHTEPHSHTHTVVWLLFCAFFGGLLLSARRQ